MLIMLTMLLMLIMFIMLQEGVQQHDGCCWTTFSRANAAVTNTEGIDAASWNVQLGLIGAGR